MFKLTPVIVGGVFFGGGGIKITKKVRFGSFWKAFDKFISVKAEIFVGE